ncbi:uncharacterized protein LOC132916047 [Bombus pascuorum]|uniref:uncharacterized protein LOC132916047 n=1 Tax=Bombus pascuorum TaxID=65598 RepID=UPI00298E8C96|nr:uncharacterized protein LOC132916047 [Bombus pascuorum]
MSKQIAPEDAIHFTRLSVALSFCWPSADNSSRSRGCYKIAQICIVINAFLILVPSLYSIYLYLDDISFYLNALFKCITLTIYTTQPIIQTCICWKKRDSLQRIIDEMVKCVNEAQKFERDIFIAHIVKYNIIYVGYVVAVYASLIFFIIGPLVLPIPTLVEVKYPFQVNYTPVNFIFYLHHSSMCFTATAHLCIGVFGALLMWFAAARFECLVVEIQKTTNIRMLVVCIEKQLHLRRYAEEVVGCFRFMILYVLGMTTVTITLFGILLIVDSPVITKVELFNSSAFCLLLTFIYAWPADYLQDASANVSRSVYYMEWHKQPLEMRKYILTVLIHQKPVTLSVSCFMPELNLRFYCSFMSSAFSFCTAMRTMVQDH